MLAEQHDEWTEGRRHLSIDVLQRSRLSVVANNDTTHDTTHAPAAEEVSIATTPRRQALSA